MIDATYAMGVGGELPGGEPITYRIQARQLVNGDVDCNGNVDAVDALKVLRNLVALPISQTDPCLEFGDDLATLWEDVLPALWADVDCDGDIDAVDAPKIQRHVVLLPVSQTEPCADIDTAFQPVP